MVKRRTRQHQTVQERYRHAHLNSLLQRAQHATRLRAVNYQRVPDARVTGGNNKRLPINIETDVANEAFVQNLIDLFTIETATLWQTLKCGARGFGNRIH